MKKSNAIRNVKVLAVNNENKAGFSIFLDFSEQQKFVMHHRHNGLIYQLLCEGIYLDDLRHWKPKPAHRHVNVELSIIVQSKPARNYPSPYRMASHYRSEQSSQL